MQASTKVYRSPRGTAFRMQARVASGGLLAVVPDPVCCFAGARYTQGLDFWLEDESASLVVVDTLTSGRAASGERWAFAHCATRIRVQRADRCIVLDAARLDPAHGPLPERMGRFDAYATIVTVGPRAAGVRDRLLSLGSEAPRPEALRAAGALSPDAALGRIADVSVARAAAAVREIVAPLVLELGDDPHARRW